MLYVAVDIGCIECGEESNVLGVFRDKKNAREALDAAALAQKKDWHGEHSFEIFEVKEIQQ